MTSDINIAHEGTLIGFRPISNPAQQWFRAHVRSEPWQWMGPTLWVDHRIAELLIAALDTEGFKLGGKQ